MSKKVTKGTGMMQRTVIESSTDCGTMSEALKVWAKSLPVEKPGDWMGDALRRQNAERCRAILATVGIIDDGDCVINHAPLREKRLDENSAQWIAAQWLAEYNVLQRRRALFASGDATPENLSRMLMATEELGRLQERMWWRAGVDTQTEKKREDLAVSGRKQVKAGQDGNAMRSDKSFKTQHGDEAQVYANDLHRQNPKLTWTAIRIAVAIRYKASGETVKKTLINPKKGG